MYYCFKQMPQALWYFCPFDPSLVVFYSLRIHERQLQLPKQKMPTPTWHFLTFKCDEVIRKCAIQKNWCTAAETQTTECRYLVSKSVRNRCVIELFVALFVLSLCPFDISVGVGAFVIGRSQISNRDCKSYIHNLHHQFELRVVQQY